MRNLGLVVGALALGAAACAAPSPPAARCALPPPRADAPKVDVRYQVAVSPTAEELCVVADVPRAATRVLVPREIEDDVIDLAVERAGAWTPLPKGDRAIGCVGERCRVSYRVLVGALAKRVHDRDLALEDNGVFESPPSTWLLRFDGLSADARYRAVVATPPGVGYVAGQFRAADEPDALEGRMGNLRDTPYAAFGPLRVSPITAKGTRIDVAFTPGATDLPPARVAAWVETNARAVADYFGKFPAPTAMVLMRVTDGAGIGNGRTMGEGGASVLLEIGAHTTERDLARDWVLVHELAHVAFPNVHTPWAEEGLSTYIEPVIRVRAGLLDEDSLWRDLIEGLPKGLPEAGDAGLDNTDTWGRRYWGGAGFWFLGDVEIRKRTGNAKSLDDALRGVTAKGGNVGSMWKLASTLEIADAAAGAPVLAPLAAKMGGGPVTPDFAAIFRDLGVRIAGARVAYDDAAPLAAIRKAISARRR